jgi:hypothetical protein
MKAADLLVKSGGPSHVFVHIHAALANDASRAPDDRLKNVDELIKLNAIAEAVAAAHTLATDSTVDIPSRLKAADRLLKFPGETDKTIHAYTQIVETTNSDPTADKNSKISYLLKAGLGLHKAGAIEQGEIY